MKPGETKTEVILQGKLEARVAAQIVTDAGHEELLESFEPPIEPPRIGRWEFIKKMSVEHKYGLTDDSEYTVRGLPALKLIALLMQEAPMSDPAIPTFSMKKYMGKRLVEFGLHAEEAGLYDEPSKPEEPAEPTLSQPVEIAGSYVFGLDEEGADLMRRRQAFVDKHLAEQGLTYDDLSIEQVIEIRQLPDWKNPPKLQG